MGGINRGNITSQVSWKAGRHIKDKRRQLKLGVGGRWERAYSATAAALEFDSVSSANEDKLSVALWAPKGYLSFCTCSSAQVTNETKIEK